MIWNCVIQEHHHYLNKFSVYSNLCRYLNNLSFIYMGKLCHLLNIKMTGISDFSFSSQEEIICCSTFPCLRLFLRQRPLCPNLPNCLPCHRACVMGINFMCFILGIVIYFYQVLQMFGVYWQKVGNVPASQGT